MMVMTRKRNIQNTIYNGKKRRRAPVSQFHLHVIPATAGQRLPTGLSTRGVVDDSSGIHFFYMDARLGADDAHFGIDIQSETYQKSGSD